jgi:hypothetical protein
MPGQHLQSAAVSCALGADSKWHATAPDAAAGDSLFCQRLHANASDGGDLKAAWLPHSLDSTALTYEPMQYIHDFRKTHFWTQYVEQDLTGKSTSLRGTLNSAAVPTSARRPDAVILSAYWWHAVFPKLLGASAPARKATGLPPADDVMADYVAGVREFLKEFAFSRAYSGKAGC